MVQVAVLIGLAATLCEEFFRFGQQALGHHLEAFVGRTPARCRAAVEHRDTHEFTHRRHAHDAHLARLARGPEAIIAVQLTRRDFGTGCCGGAGGGEHSQRSGAPRRRERGDAGASFEQPASCQALFLFTHRRSPSVGFRDLVRVAEVRPVVMGRERCRSGRITGAAFVGLDDDRTARVILVEHLTIQA